MDPLSRLDAIRQTLASLGQEVEALRRELKQVAPQAAADPGWPAVVSYVALGPSLAEDALLNTILRCAMHVTRAGGAGLTVFDGKKQKLVFRAVVGEGAEELVGYEVPLEGSQHGLAFATGEIQAGAPIHKQVDALAETTFQQVLVAPLMVDGQPIGTLSAVNKEQAASFTAEDIETYGLFSDLAALVVRQRMRESLLRQRIEGALDDVPDELAALAFGEREVQVMRLVDQVAGLAGDREELVPLMRQLVDAIARASGGRFP